MLTFHDAAPDEWIDRIFAVAALTPQHTHMILTKRSGRMREYLSRPAVEVRIGLEALGLVLEDHARNRRSTLGKGVTLRGSDINPGALKTWPLPNVWLGVSVEDQTRADERIPDLLATPAAVRFLSCEPLLGPVDLTRIMEAGRAECFHSTKQEPFKLGDRTWTEARASLNSLTGHYWGEDLLDGRWEGWCGEEDQPSPGFGEPGYHKPLDWVIAGGESGPGARPMHPDWARSLRDQCAAAGVPFHFKQWGEWELSLDRDKDDPDWRADYTSDYVDHDKSKWLNLAGGCGFHGERFVVMRKVGKKTAGRMLDGIEHNGMPA